MESERIYCNEEAIKHAESTRTFVELVVRYPDPELCAYKEYKGKPYYSIKYIENGETHVSYGTYNPEVLSQYLKCFMPSAQPEPSIPISWIEKQIDWLKSMNNGFSKITAMNISLLVKKWRKEKGEINGKSVY